MSDSNKRTSSSEAAKDSCEQAKVGPVQQLAEAVAGCEIKDKQTEHEDELPEQNGKLTERKDDLPEHKDDLPERKDGLAEDKDKLAEREEEGSRDGAGAKTENVSDAKTEGGMDEGPKPSGQPGVEDKLSEGPEPSSQSRAEDKLSEGVEDKLGEGLEPKARAETEDTKADNKLSEEIEARDEEASMNEKAPEEQPEDNEDEPLLGEAQPQLPPRPRTETGSGTGTGARANTDVETGTQYKLKDIQWHDPATGRTREVKIVTQNENGPCPLIALANALQLAGTMQIAGSRRTISAGELVGELAELLFAHDAGSPAVAEADVAAILALLPTLSTGLDVDLQFAHVHDFAEAASVQLFRAFGVDLVHGWVVDAAREPRVAAVLTRECRNSYEGAVEYILAADEASGGRVMQAHGGSGGAHGSELSEAAYDALAVNVWLEQSATQLTERGLQMLGTMLADGRLSVLFRNNHFSTLYKRAPGELFVLCTDDAVAGDARVVWESLRDVQQATSQFFDSQFRALRVGDDYARQAGASRGASADAQEAAQIDEDYALALRLHEQEQEQSRPRNQGRQSQQPAQLQVRQQDRMPPGMRVREHGHLYGVPEVSREGEQQLARAMYRSASDENFERRMENTFMPNKAAASRAQQQQQQRQRKADDSDDKCIIC
ncbi:hypothetical protein IWW50_000070 [Coemansia erecta]|nr:hypothetical protein GGF43_000445 [Coemansia sp. RSA 2618]KAJ2830754.1 hypothetical protein IWW50_000070 [Coemansia erecta]